MSNFFSIDRWDFIPINQLIASALSRFIFFFWRCVLSNLTRNRSAVLGGVLPETLTGPLLVKLSHAFYGFQRFITAIHKRTPPVPFLSQINPVHTSPSLLLQDQFLILSTYLRLGLPNGLLPSGIPTKTLYAAPISAICTAHLVLYLINRVSSVEYRW